jgi:hypothetical protein
MTLWRHPTSSWFQVVSSPVSTRKVAVRALNVPTVAEDMIAFFRNLFRNSKRMAGSKQSSSRLESVGEAVHSALETQVFGSSHHQQCSAIISKCHNGDFPHGHGNAFKKETAP